MKDSEAKVAIIILNWNGWENTLRCLRSVSCLDYGSIITIVVDNASTDGSASKIRSEFPDVVVLENSRNLGFGGGCNVGIRYAIEQAAGFIWLLNNDTEVNPTVLSALLSEARSDPRIGAVGSVLYYMDTPTRIQAWGGGRVNLWTGRSRHFDRNVQSRYLDYLTAASLLLKTEALLDVGFFDEETFFMYWEDADLCFRLRARGWKLAVAQDACVWHVESASLAGKKPLLVAYSSASSISFYKRYSPFPALPILVMVFGRLYKYTIKRDWECLMAVLEGAGLGLRLGSCRT